jgi:hypothetical protein
MPAGIVALDVDEVVRLAVRRLSSHGLQSDDAAQLHAQPQDVTARSGEIA